MIHDGGAHEGNLDLETDVVVVGSGAGGAVVAAVLAKSGARVLILEEGAHVSKEQYAEMRPSQHTRTLWRDAGLTFAIGVGDSPFINVMMGKCVGGSSALTGGVCFRTPEHVLETWRTKRGLPQFTPEHLEPYFASVERAIHVGDVPEALWSNSTKRFADGARALGRPLKAIRRNTDGCEGFSKCNFGCPKHAKRSVDLTYLPEALEHGAQLWSRCLVEQVTSADGRASGVTGRVLNGPRNAPGGRLSVKARRVVVAAGSYHSPLILMDSGVGRLSEQVGRNMTLHPAFRVMARFDEPVNGWRGALQGAWSDAFEHERITLTAMFTPPGVLAATLPGIGQKHRENARQIPYLGVFGGMIHDDGGGRVRHGPGREPLATYRMAAEDKAALPKLMRGMAETWLAAGAKEVFLPVLGLHGLTKDQLKTVDLDHVPGKKFECSSQHPLGTCRMGPDPASSVVNAEGESWDLKELYVADGSLVPTSLGVNPQLTIMALALRVAEHMRPL